MVRVGYFKLCVFYHNLKKEGSPLWEKRRQKPRHGVSGGPGLKREHAEGSVGTTPSAAGCLQSPADHRGDVHMEKGESSTQSSLQARS